MNTAFKRDIARLHGGDLERFQNGVPRGTRPIIDFSVNINPLGLSAQAKAALVKNIDRVIHYPEPYSESLKKALADFHGISRDHLAVGNGSIDLIYLIPKAVRAGKTLMIAPSFSEYEFAARANGSKIVFVETKEKENFSVSLERIRKVISGIDLAYLCNPNNPTGRLLSIQEISAIAKLCARHQTVLAVDEVFMDFVETRGEDSLLPAASKNKYLLVLRSLTKFFALPGLRIGCAVGPRDLIRKISRLQYPWSVNALAQAAGEAVLKGREYMNESRAYVSKERRFLSDRLQKIKGLKVYTAASNFIFCKLETCALGTAAALNRALLKRGLAVRDCGNFRGLNERFFRLAVRRRNENLRLLAALKEIL